MAAKKSSNIIDHSIINQFSDTLKILNIKTEDIERNIYNFSLPKIDKATIKKLSSTGIIMEKGFDEKYVSLHTEKNYVLDRGRIVFIYMREQKLSDEDYHAGRFRKFHLCNCYKLLKSQKKGDFNGKYVRTTRTDGKFVVDLYGKSFDDIREIDVLKPLHVCWDCLNHIDWKGFSACVGPDPDNIKKDAKNYWKMDKIAKEFKISEFLRSAEKDLIEDMDTLYDASGVPKSKYSLSTSEKYSIKKSRNFRCEQCGKKFSSKELEIHHKNKVIWDNSANNLMVICTKCHDIKHPGRVNGLSII